MENNNNKSQAEIYREERKARLAKEAAKKAKKSPKLSKTKKIAGRVIAIVLAVVLVFGAVGGILNFFGAPQKVIKVKAGDNKEYSFTLAEFNYYYFLTWSNYQQTAVQYENYGSGMGLQFLGYDYSKSPDKQSYTDDHSSVTGVTVADLGVTNPTWADAFTYAAVSQIIQIKYGALKAAEAGITVTEDEQAEIDSAIESARKTASENDYSLDRFLRATYGNGVSEKVVRQVYTESYLATSYFDKLQEDTENAVTDAQVEEKYNANKDNYDLASIRLYEFTTEVPEAAEGATEEEKTAAAEKAYAETKAKADAFLAAVSDSASFVAQANVTIKSADSSSKLDADETTDFSDITYATLDAKGEALAKWVYDDARVAGDKAVIDLGSGTYDVVLVTAAPHKDMSVSTNDVRHILVKFPQDESGNTQELTDTQKAEYKAKAQAILDEYKKDATEDNFAALATEKSEDTGSASNGGLIEGITKSSNYVTNFLNWSTDASRKPGDTDIIETEYGYHVMYYVKAEGVTWYETVKEEIVSEIYSNVFENLIDTQMSKINLNSPIIKWAVNSEIKLIKNRIAMNY
ncbi:MAG: peptidylprolyl isomerase [Candidatus Fimenecus sp.]